MKKIRGFETVNEGYLKTFKNVKDVIMPLRTSKKSAGYDFFAFEDFEILPETSYFFWTDIKAYMLDDEVLKLYPRSSIGIKKDIKIKNTVGIIDSDYYSNIKNDGNIGIILYNFGLKTRYFKKRDGVIQGIFEKYLKSDNCNSEEERKGGIGSTNK
jgi:dUTP pyrophosphatase